MKKIVHLIKKIVFSIYLRMNKEEKEAEEMVIIIIGEERRYEMTACIEGN